ncbi:hypothetical protein BD560DRAFT_388300 [Blakeslea trispora]|nr:hypothetical protein BD560DRAFT_388300 [Blakeslea trispora]
MHTFHFFLKMIKQSRTVLHLAITTNTALRTVLFVAKDKIDWYNDHGLHKLVLEALYPVILENLVHESTLSKKQGILYKEGFRILFRFTTRHIQQTLIQTSKDFSFLVEDDTKPIAHTDYRALSIYPYQLVVSVDNQLTSNPTLDTYFDTL